MDVPVLDDVRREHPQLYAHFDRLGPILVKDFDAALEKEKRLLEEKVRRETRLDALKDDVIIRAYRDFYWSIGVDPTKTRPASEALIRRILQGKELPRINTAVDAYNMASVETRIALACLDASKVGGQIVIRLATQGETFSPIGSEPLVLTGQEIVIADNHGPVSIYPYRDADRSKITTKTTEVLIIACGVPGIGRDPIIQAVERAMTLIRRFCRP